VGYSFREPQAERYAEFSTFCKNVLSPLLLRVALAAIFIFHGLDLVGGAEKEWGARWQTGENAPPAAVQLAVAWGELIGGIVLGLGFLTRLAALGIIAVMAEAIARAHWPNAMDIRNIGFLYNLAVIIMCLCLVLGGPGPLAVDRVFHFRRRGT
jgi:putative oxidoreductase